MKRLISFMMCTMFFISLFVPTVSAMTENPSLDVAAKEYYYQDALERDKESSSGFRSTNNQSQDVVYSDGGIEIQGNLVRQTILQTTKYAHGSVAARARDYWYRYFSGTLLCTVTAGCTFDVVNGVSVAPGGYEYIEMEKYISDADLYLNEGPNSWTTNGPGTKCEFLYKYNLDFGMYLHYGQLKMSCDNNAQVTSDPDETAYA